MSVMMRNVAVTAPREEIADLMEFMQDSIAYLKAENEQWKQRYESLNHIRCNLDIKLTELRAENERLRRRDEKKEICQP